MILAYSTSAGAVPLEAGVKGSGMYLAKLLMFRGNHKANPVHEFITMH